jgi:3-hydroxyisobutyrate dehydrogenase-like beta-hydroxyacid dehydrogenase
MAADPIRTIGFVGFGVRVWNRTRGKLARSIDAGAQPAASPAEAADGADAVCLCVTDKTAVESVLFGEGGVAHAALYTLYSKPAS